MPKNKIDSNFDKMKRNIINKKKKAEEKEKDINSDVNTNSNIDVNVEDNTNVNGDVTTDVNSNVNSNVDSNVDNNVDSNVAVTINRKKDSGKVKRTYYLEPNIERGISRLSDKTGYDKSEIVSMAMEYFLKNVEVE